MHYSFINDLPQETVTDFLVAKGIVENPLKAMELYKITHVHQQGYNCIKTISRNDFMKMFCRYMFVDALIKVTRQIDQQGVEGVHSKRRQDIAKETPLVLKINQFERQQMMNSLNPASETYQQGQKIIRSLLIMIEKEQEFREKNDPNYTKKQKMTYDEFMDDPFGKKKMQMEEYYAQQRKGIQTLADKEEKIDENNPFGQLQHPVILADAPQQPENIQNRQLNQIYIANKQHLDLKPVNITDLNTYDPFDKFKIEQVNRHKEDILRVHTAKDRFNELAAT